MTNIQVTLDLSPHQARNESRIAINPQKTMQMVAVIPHLTQPIQVIDPETDMALRFRSLSGRSSSRRNAL
jgi:hypothetical protein